MTQKLKQLDSVQTLAHELKTAKDLNITVKNIKYFSGHDGMRGINADIYLNNKKFATAYDDAHGGCMDVRPCNYDVKTLDTFSKIESELKALPEYEHVFSESRTGIPIGGEPVTMKTRVDLAAIVDAVAQQKEAEKEAKKGLVYLKGGDEYIIQWKGTNLSKLVKKSEGFNIVQNRYNDLIKAGRTVLNLTYLESLGLKI